MTIVTVEKLSLSFEPALAERARRAAESSGQSLSAFVAGAVEYRLRLEEGRRLLAEWEAEQGPISERELLKVRSKWPALTLDTGALIAADRNDRSFWAFWKEALVRGVVPVIPAPALVKAWRNPRHARLAQVVKACWVEPLEETLAKSAGELCGRARTSDVVDAAVVAGAARRGDAVLTSDPRDLRRLAAIVGAVEVIKL